jgi:hypothetical protein
MPPPLSSAMPVDEVAVEEEEVRECVADELLCRGLASGRQRCSSRDGSSSPRVAVLRRAPLSCRLPPARARHTIGGCYRQ